LGRRHTHGKQFNENLIFIILICGLLNKRFAKLLQKTRRCEIASYKFKDISMKCEFEVKAPNADEILPTVAMQAEKSHNMKET
jgi:hypothetical protein